MLHVHRAERADRLADGLAETLLEPLEDPFAPDVVAVPTRGIERWLTQRLSTRLGTTGDRQDGVCANVEFPFPGRLIQAALAAATGIDPDNDPWLAERSVWPPARGRRRVPRRAVAGDACAPPRGRPRRPGGPDAPVRGGPPHRRPVRSLRRAPSGHGASLGRRARRRPDGPDAWQPELWRRLRARIGVPSPAERLAPACERIRERRRGCSSFRRGCRCSG